MKVRVFFVFVLSAALASFAWAHGQHESQSSQPAMTGGSAQSAPAQTVSLIEQGKVRSALLTDKNQTIQITTKSGQLLEASWVGNQGQQVATLLQKKLPPKGYNVSVPSGNSLLSLILGWLPFVLVILVFFFLLNQMQGGGSRVMNFGKSRAKVITKDIQKTTFADVEGAGEDDEDQESELPRYSR